MGQSPSNSGSSSGEVDLAHMQGKVIRELKIFRSLATVSYANVVRSIEELNTVTTSFTDHSGKQLRFLIHKGTDTTIFWKTTIRIRCLKINTNNNKIESCRLLGLREFILMYKEIIDQVSILSSPEITVLEDEEVEATGINEDAARAVRGLSPEQKEAFTASSFFTGADLKNVLINECCVCMDKKASIMLSCNHEFCEACIDSWTRDARHCNCPLCRHIVAGKDDTWVLADQAETSDYEKEVKGYLVGLADRKDSASS